MSEIGQGRIPLGNDIKVTKNNPNIKNDKTIDLTTVNKEEDLGKINKFIQEVESNPANLENWNVKVNDSYIDISENKQSSLKLMKDVKKYAEGKDTFDGKLYSNKELILTEIKLPDFSSKSLGEHDTDGYTLNPLDNVITSGSDLKNKLILGKPLKVFGNVADAEKYAKSIAGSEVIIRNKNNQYEVHQVKRITNSDEFKESDGDGKIRANNFTENHSRFDKGFLKSVGSDKGFLVTDDNQTLEIAGQTGIEVGKADYNVVSTDMSLKLIDTNGIQNTNGLHDWQGTLNGQISIDLKPKLEEVLNSLDLPKGTRVNVDYNETDKSFDVKLNYEMVSERVGELTALKIKPEANGSLSLSSIGVFNANINLKDGLSVNANAGFIGASANISAKETDQISVDAKAKVGPLKTQANANFQKNIDNKYDVGLNVGKSSNKNIFPTVLNSDAHKTIAGAVISICDSIEQAGFIMPQELKNAKANIKNWGSDDSKAKSQEVKDKQVINDFVNGNLKMQYDLSKQMNLKGFPNASINKFDPNIQFNSENQKLNVVFNNSELIASSDGKSKVEAQKNSTPDLLSVDLKANLNNTTANVKTNIKLQADITDEERNDFSKKLTEMGANPTNAKISGSFSAEINAKGETNSSKLNNINMSADVSIKTNDVSVFLPNTNTKINLRKADLKAGADIKVLQEDNRTSLKADAKVSLSGFSVFNGNEKLVSLGASSFKGKLSYDYKESVGEDNKKTTKTKILVQGHLDVINGKYDDFNVKKLSADGLVSYTEKEGVSFSSTTESAIKLSGVISNPEQNTNLNIKNIFGYGRVDVDKNGAIKSAEIKAGSTGNSEFKVDGQIQGQNFTLEANLKTKGQVKFNNNNEKIDFSINGDLDKFKMGDLDLQNIKNLNANISYDQKNNSITISANTGKNLDLKGKIQGQDFTFKGNASVTIQLDQTTGKLNVTPNAKVEHLGLGNFELKDAELKGTKISLTPNNGFNKIQLESLDNQNIEFKGTFINGKSTTPVNIKGNGNIEVNASKTGQNTTYTLTSNSDFEKFEIDDVKFKNATLDGKVSFDGQNITLGGATNEQYLNFKAQSVDSSGKDTNLEFLAKGNLTLIPSKNNSGFEFISKNTELKKGVINDISIDDAKLNGRIIYNKNGSESSISFKGLDDKNPQLNISGQVTRTEIDKNNKENKYVAKIEDLGLEGGVTFENNKMKFVDLKSEITGNINGVPINNLISLESNKDGSLELSLGGDTDGLYLGSSLKIKSLPDGKMNITSIGDNGSLKFGVDSKDDILKMLDDVSKIGGISSNPNLAKDMNNIKKQMATFSTLNMQADLGNFNLIYDPKGKNVYLDSDLNGQIGTKLSVDRNTDINFKHVDIQGKLKADTESNELSIANGVMKGTTDNLEDMILSSLAKSGVIPKDYKFDKETDMVTFKKEDYDVNINMKKTGIGDKSRISLKTGIDLGPVNLNYNLTTKITVENIAPKGQPPKNVVKIHLDKSNISGLATLDLQGKARTLFGLVKMDVNKKLELQRNPYLDFVETLDNSKTNTEADYKKVRQDFEQNFLSKLPSDASERERNRKLEKALKENNLDSFDNYQMHTGAFQLLDRKTIIFDLEEFLKNETSGQAEFSIEPSKNILSGNESEDNFNLNFSMKVKNLNTGDIELPKDEKTPSNVGQILNQLPKILDDTLDVSQKIQGTAKDINSGVSSASSTFKREVNNTVGQVGNINNEIRGTNSQIKSNFNT